MKASRCLLNIAYRSNSGIRTGIAGIYGFPNPRPTLLEIYKSTLQELSKFPESSVYRQAVENTTKHRQDIVENNEHVPTIEALISAGLIEEVLIQAGEELKLVKKMAEYKPWEPLQEEIPQGQWEYGRHEPM